MIGLFPFFLWTGNIELHDLFALKFTDIAYLNGDGNFTFIVRDFFDFDCEFGITQTITERINRRYVCAVEITISDINALFITRIVPLSEITDRLIVGGILPKSSSVSPKARISL